MTDYILPWIDHEFIDQEEAEEFMERQKQRAELLIVHNGFIVRVKRDLDSK